MRHHPTLNDIAPFTLSIAHIVPYVRWNMYLLVSTG